LLFLAAHHDLERIIGQWSLQCLRLIPVPLFAGKPVGFLCFSF
jgi:hypothetical protein